MVYHFMIFYIVSKVYMYKKMIVEGAYVLNSSIKLCRILQV